MIDEEMIDQTTETPSNQEVETTVVEEKPKKRIKKKKSKARVITEWILTGIFGVIFIFVLAGQLDGMIHAKDHHNQQLRFGTGSFIVTTNSMEPEYPVGTAIITYLSTGMLMLVPSSFTESTGSSRRPPSPPALLQIRRFRWFPLC